MEVAKPLERVLAKHRVSQAELARALGMSRSTVSLWLAGKRYPSIKTMAWIAWALDEDVNNLFEVQEGE